MWEYNYGPELAHHGIKGMKWGVRRFQKKDGSLTSAGKSRYARAADAAQRDADDLRKHGYTKEADAVQAVANKNRQKAEKQAAKAAGKKQYKATQVDELLYGKKGAERIADRRNKGDSRKKAVAKELGRQAVTGLAISAIGTASAYALTSGNATKAVKKAIQTGKNILDNYNNISILDSSGKVLTRYHESVKVGEAAVNALLKR